MSDSVRVKPYEWLVLDDVNYSSINLFSWSLFSSFLMIDRTVWYLFELFILLICLLNRHYKIWQSSHNSDKLTVLFLSISSLTKSRLVNVVLIRQAHAYTFRDITAISGWNWKCKPKFLEEDRKPIWVQEIFICYEFIGRSSNSQPAASYEK